MIALISCYAIWSVFLLYLDNLVYPLIVLATTIGDVFLAAITVLWVLLYSTVGASTRNPITD